MEDPIDISTIKITIPTLIQADVPTINNRVYSKEVLEQMVQETNTRINNGTLIPLRDPLGSDQLSDVKEVVRRLLLESGSLQATVEILDRDTRDLVHTSHKPILNTMVLCNSTDYTDSGDGILHIHKAEFVATCLIDPQQED